MSCKLRKFDTCSSDLNSLASKLDNIKIVPDISLQPTPMNNGKLFYDLGTNALYMSLNGKYVPANTGSKGTTIPVVSFGSSLPQTNAASALATIVDPAHNPLAVVRDADKNEVVLHVYTQSGWVAHRDKDTIPTFDTSNLATKTELAGKQEDVGFALADIDGNGNDDVYNKLGHKLMLTDSSGHIIPVVHDGQAISKQYLDGIVGTLASLLTTNKGNIVGALNELYNTGNRLNADIQAKLQHLTSAEHIIEFNTGNPSDPATSQAALATITNPTEGNKALLVDKTANKSRLEIYHNNGWITLTDDVGGTVDLTNYQTITQADSKYATKTALAGKQDTLTTAQKAVVDANPFTTVLKNKLDGIDMSQYQTTVQADAKYARIPKLLPTPADPTAENAYLVAENLGSIYEAK